MKLVACIILLSATMVSCINKSYQLPPTIKQDKEQDFFEMYKEYLEYYPEYFIYEVRYVELLYINENKGHISYC